MSPTPDLEPNRLHPCPNKPNCVSSLATDPRHAIPAIAYQGSAEQALAKMAKIISQLPRTRILVRQDNYLHAEFRSLVFRFVDDVELLADPERQLLQLRSASRLGYRDFGVNRERIEQLRELFNQQTDSTE